jgi:hypothetical protein
MTNPSEEGSLPLTRALTIAELFALARIHAWGVRAWQPKSGPRPAFIVLNDPAQSSVNPRVVTQLLNAGFVEAAHETLIVTLTGAEALLERPEVLLRMQASGAI